MNNPQAIKTLAKGKIILHADDDGVIIEKTDFSKIPSSQLQKLLWILQNIFWGVLLITAGLLVLYFFIDKTSLSCYKESASAKMICQAEQTYTFRKDKKEVVLSSRAINSVVLDESENACRIVLIDEAGSRHRMTTHYSSMQCRLHTEVAELNSNINSNRAFPKKTIDIQDNFFKWIAGAVCLFLGVLCFYFLFKSGVEMYFVFDKKRKIFEVYKVNIFGEYIEEYSFQDISHINYEDNLNDDDAQPKGPHVVLKSGKTIDMITFGSLEDREYIASLLRSHLELR